MERVRHTRTSQPRPTCPYCGRKVRTGSWPTVRRGWFADGTDFVGHRTCWLELNYPDDPVHGHARHDIPIGRAR